MSCHIKETFKVKFCMTEVPDGQVVKNEMYC